MSAKPSAVPSWATDTNYTSGPEIGNPTKVALSLGAKAQGWRPGDPLGAQNLNDWMNDVGEWLQYLNDGAFEDNLSVEGSFTAGVAGNVTGTTSAQIGGDQLQLGHTFTFTSFTFTADAGSNLLTKVAHGLRTGDGPIRVANSGGGLPGGLAALTDYWIVKSTDDTFFLATSFINAIRAGATTIDITTAGTGTHTLSAGGACTRATLLRVQGNAVVDGVTTAAELTVTGETAIGGSATVGGTYRHTGTRTIETPITGGMRRTAGSNPPDGDRYDEFGQQIVTLGSGDLVFVPLPNLPVGARLHAVRVRTGGSGSMTARLQVLDTAGAGTGSVSNRSDETTITVGDQLIANLGLGAGFEDIASDLAYSLIVASTAAISAASLTFIRSVVWTYSLPA